MRATRRKWRKWFARRYSPVQSRSKKYSLFTFDPNHRLISAVLFRKRGVGHRHERWNGMRWTQQHQRARRRADEWRCCVRQSRVVPTPRRWRLSPREASFSRAMVARKPGHQGERVISRKTIVQGMPGRFRRTCGDYRVLTTFCTRAAGATSTRHSLRPLF